MRSALLWERVYSQGGNTMYKHLSFTDRLKIEAWERTKIPPRVMAEQLGVHISTIYRELKRGRYTHLNSDYTTEDRYSPDIAEQKYRDNLKAKGPGLKIGNDREYAEYLERKVKIEKYAPGAILGEIKRKGLRFSTSISKTTFYRYIDEGVFLTISNKDLPVKKNKKKKVARRQPSRAPIGKSIEKRPAEVLTRSSFGNWEMDSVVGKKGTRKALLVLTERKSRQEILRLMPDKTAASVNRELDRLEREMGRDRFAKVFKTITCDNGSEFSDYAGMERSAFGGKRTTVYFCHPYCSCERGTNENQNKMVRRWYPKGTDFTRVTKKEIKKLEDWINHYPRGLFGFASSAEVYADCMNL